MSIEPFTTAYYRAGAATHACACDLQRRLASALRSERGQGTVEYVALILLVALVMAGVVASVKGFKTDKGGTLADALLNKISDAIDKVKF
ncbi:Flp family type IVb pilin [Thermoleophilum album]|uniref:Pilus assembly protein Flp/PilA n=1 Tax=Thermoleophilum album TaxID=29539 RepID=A0A1H6FS52_THEAL|nr:hypothetical protein [Thermoleophilum album]SEH13726.1 hypothetical protein SAMN02745716_1284 [Thermoleophilum album]